MNVAAACPDDYPESFNTTIYPIKTVNSSYTTSYIKAVFCNTFEVYSYLNQSCNPHPIFTSSHSYTSFYSYT